ncbi:hypothetical protein KHQ88_01840 [Mycoplasmatota bacterium]|nr:hypothetical protein KHQ88_01840 [Mycoplasmatota bacterium]
MKKLAILLFLLMITFVGCQNKQLNAPENIAYDPEGVIIWDEVENADEYLVKLQGQEFTTDIALYDITDVITAKGLYEVEIIALSDDFEDSESSTYTLKVDYNEDAEIDLRFQGDSLVWDEVFLASHYLVTYGYEFSRVETPMFSLSSLPQGTHELTVQAVFEGTIKTEIFNITYTK